MGNRPASTASCAKAIASPSIRPSRHSTVTPLLRLRDHPLRVTRFVADVHLGGLAHLLRMTGFDTLFDTGFEDSAIAAIAARDHRIVLTRDCELLKRREITHGCFVHARKSALQLREIFARLDLARSARPFTLCVHCNAPLRGIDKSLVQQRVPAPVFDCYERFRQLRCLRTDLLGRLASAAHACLARRPRRELMHPCRPSRRFRNPGTATEGNRHTKSSEKSFLSHILIIEQRAH